MRYMMMAQILLFAAAAGCARTTGGGSPEGAITLTDREWSLVSLGGSPAPKGAGERPATLRLETTGSRAAGFAGCNQYGGPYTLAGGKLTFGSMISTRMFCENGSDLEQKYLMMLPLVTSYSIEDSTLTLQGASGPLAEYRGR